MVTIFHPPAPRHVLRHALPTLVESSIIPFIVFTVAMRWYGSTTALLCAIGWSLLALLRRLGQRRRVPALLVLGVAALAVRTVFSLLSGSLTLYFIQPQLTSVMVAGLFMGSVLIGKPLAWRLANDFLPLPVQALSDPVSGPAFGRLSMVWALLNLTKAGANVWSFRALSVEQYVVVKGLISLVVMGGGICASAWWMRRVLHRAPTLALAGVASKVPHRVAARP